MGLTHQGLADLGQGLLGIGIAANLAEHAGGLLILTIFGQPARGLRHEEHQHQKRQGGHQFGTEHPAPAGLAIPGRQNVGLGGVARHRIGDHQVHQLGRQHPQDYGELVDGHKLAPLVGRAYLGDVHGGERRGQTYPYAAYDAIDHEQIEVAGSGRAPGRDGEEDGGQDQRLLATEAIGGPAGDGRPQHATHQRRAHGPAGLGRIRDGEVGLIEGFGPAYHHPVVAEQQATAGGHQADHPDVAHIEPTRIQLISRTFHDALSLSCRL